MIVEQIELGNGSAIGLKFDMEHAPLVVIRARKGFVMCGYLDVNIANKLGDVAVRVTGVNSFEDVLDAKAVDVSEAAKNIGITIGMQAKEALKKMV
ncbi:MAG: YunC family protein [Candidatus Methanoperedens sp.]